MYHCQDCGEKFETAAIYYETHGLDTPPFELIPICPVCKSTEIRKVDALHCRCCGARLSASDREYCDEDCRRRGEKLRALEQKRRREREDHPLTKLIREADEYNRKHGTHYSYGQYVALEQPEIITEITRKESER